MSAQLLELHPHPGTPRPLEGCYLGHDLHHLGSLQRPFVYANFVTSLDGRIALAEPGSGEFQVPAALGNGHDWRLFQELQAQADCMVTHGAYLRALAAHRHPDILQVGLGEGARDLADWRRQHGLAPQPAIAIVSRRLDFVLPDSLARHGQEVHILTGAAAPAERVRYWQERGHAVHVAGSSLSVDGHWLSGTLARLGYARQYLLAGPQLLDTALLGRALSRLYLTLSHQILGGEPFQTLSAGARLEGFGRLRLHSLYYDAEAPADAGQFFATFDVRGGRAAQT